MSTLPVKVKGFTKQVLVPESVPGYCTSPYHNQPDQKGYSY